MVILMGPGVKQYTKETGQTLKTPLARARCVGGTHKLISNIYNLIEQNVTLNIKPSRKCLLLIGIG